VPHSGESMRMAELTRVSGVPTATIKFYLREGLLQPGTRTAPNQATYSHAHVRQLRLIRALREVGGLRIETIRRVLASVDGAESPWQVLGRVCDAIGESQRAARAATAARTRAAADVDAFLSAQGFRLRPGASARTQLVDALAAIRAALGEEFPVEVFAWYSEAVKGLAAREVEASDALSRSITSDGAESLPREPGGPFDLAALLEAIVYGTVLFEPVLLAMRRLWHERFAEETGLASGFVS
jgi:DNA-binding transcriptional MerR regulator